jgi:membrane-associated phospholipid phosphatase
MELARSATGTGVPSSTSLRPAMRPPIPVLEPRPAGLATTMADRMPGRHPATVFALTALAGWLVLEAAMLALGVLLVDVALHAGAFDRTDERISRWFFEQRTATLNDLSYIGSMIGDIPVLPGLVVLAVIVLLIGHRIRAAAFIATAGVLELATYRVTSLIIHRERPLVPRLDDLPGNQSYPSGHMAASIAVYGALALVLTSRFPQRWVAITVWTLAVALPAIVALSRLYRGMHHLSDIVAGGLMGVAALLIALLAARACGVAVGRRLQDGREVAR